MIRDLWDREVKPEGIPVSQGYIAETDAGTVRIRIKGSQGFITVKGRASGITRPEFEYPIPLNDVGEMMRILDPPKVSKTRYAIPFAGKTWEVDVFDGLNAGLITAEIELKSEEESFEKPPWVGEEVTADHRYANSELARRPFRKLVDIVHFF
ncbi:MAG: CYTH domain-containing protein [Desulfobacterales bacterium]|nr:CYTH domain-containing protein [Desulfobacterales bacterium]